MQVRSQCRLNVLIRSRRFVAQLTPALSQDYVSPKTEPVWRGRSLIVAAQRIVAAKVDVRLLTGFARRAHPPIVPCRKFVLVTESVVSNQGAARRNRLWIVRVHARRRVVAAYVRAAVLPQRPTNVHYRTFVSGKVNADSRIMLAL